MQIRIQMLEAELLRDKDTI